MNIIYITVALDNLDFDSLNKKWHQPLNPSNQNFHYKMIKSLSLTNHIDVISIRPFNKKMSDVKVLKPQSKIVGDVCWHYLEEKGSKIRQWLSLRKQCKNIVDSLFLDNACIIFDTLNQKCILAAQYLRQQTGLPIIGMVTDSPYYISGVNKMFADMILSSNDNLDGYLCLSERLDELYNKSHRPSLVFEGIIDEYNAIDNYSNNYGDYFFFGGALLKKYGIYNLIDAFKQINNDNIKLVIAGHHEEEGFKEYISNDKRIVYLGALPVEQIIQLENHSLANINPRPANKSFDQYSIPSKTIEYLSADSITISLPNPILRPLFENEIIWVKDEELNSLSDAMEKVLDMEKDEREKLIKEAKNKAKSRYCLKNINEKINLFLSQNFK